jgi:hypothetical protein
MLMVCHKLTDSLRASIAFRTSVSSNNTLNSFHDGLLSPQDFTELERDVHKAMKLLDFFKIC